MRCKGLLSMSRTHCKRDWGKEGEGEEMEEEERYLYDFFLRTRVLFTRTPPTDSKVNKNRRGKKKTTVSCIHAK